MVQETDQHYEVRIELHDHQAGDRTDRLMAVIPYKSEKIDIGYPEDAHNNIGHIRLLRHIVGLIVTVPSVGVGVAGAVRVVEAVKVPDIPLVLLGIAEFAVGGGLASETIRWWQREVKKLNDVSTGVGHKFRTLINKDNLAISSQ